MSLAEKPSDKKRVVIVGAGFGGISCAHKLAATGLDVVLIDRNDYTLFQPLLYQVATGALREHEIAEPIRQLIRHWDGVSFTKAEVEGLDPTRQVLQTSIGPVAYDYLVIAAGNVPNYFGNETIHKAAFTLTALPMASALRNHVLTLYDQASAEPDAAKRQAMLTFVVVGGGPIGVEFSGALAELTQQLLEKDYPDLKREEVRIILLQRDDALLPPFPSKGREETLRRLQELGVDVRLHASAKAADEQSVTLEDGTAVPASTLLWATGVKAPALTARLNLPLGHGGRIQAQEDFSVPGYPNIFAIGDIAEYVYDGSPLPGLAQPAIQGGEHVAEVITKVREGGKTIKPFRYLDKGIMAVIGRGSAIAGLPRPRHMHEMHTPAEDKYMTLTGFPAWTSWLGLHIAYLHGFDNRFSAVIDWNWDYVRGDSHERLITLVSKEQAQAAAEA